VLYSSVHALPRAREVPKVVKSMLANVASNDPMHGMIEIAPSFLSLKGFGEGQVAQVSFTGLLLWANEMHNVTLGSWNFKLEVLTLNYLGNQLESIGG